MKNHTGLLLIAIIATLFCAYEVQGATVVYNYYRAPDAVNSHAGITAETWENGLSAYNTDAGTGPEGAYLPGSGSPPVSTLQQGYDEYNQWSPDYYGTPSPWRTVYSKRIYESPNSLSLTTGGCILSPGVGCAIILYPYPAQNPIVTVSGNAQADRLKISGYTSVFATGNRLPPVAKSKEIISIKNGFTLLPGTSMKLPGESSLVSLVFRLHGSVRTPLQSHSLVGGDLSIGPSGNRLATASLYTDIRNGSSYGTSGSSSFSYSTNTGISSNTSDAIGAQVIYGFDSGTLTLQFNALVGTRYDVNLSLVLLNEINGSADLTAFSSCDFSDAFNVVIESSDGTVLSWDVPLAADTTAPVIGDFTLPATSNSLEVAVGITATDNSGTVASYCLNESNNSATCTWNAQKPVSYTFASTGSKTLYAFAKDASKNISAPVSANVLIPFYFNVSLTGDGGGSVHSSPMTDISCLSGVSGGCSGRFGTIDVTLSASPDALTSLFDGWSGACTSTKKDCTISLSSDVNVNVAFKLASRTKLSLNAVSGFVTLQEAYDNASTEIYALQGMFSENWLLDKNKDIVLAGGYLADYGPTRNSFTTLNGTLTIHSGSLQVDGLAVSTQ